MGKVALYRRYRSNDFSELVGQKLVASTLEHAISSGKVSHAYLFTGPRGVGKTTVARILARKVNKIDDITDHPDIIEIDAASNNGVDEIRDLREKVYIAPNLVQYKVYIIDEVHMLSNAAFNALLKTLEEPPSHVIFVLATTEPHKLPQTIISRTQHFPFRPISKSETVDHLKEIAKKEKVTIEDSAVELLADMGEGSMRDSISLLDQISSSGQKKITVSHIEDLLGLAPQKNIQRLLDSALSHDIATTIEAYDEILHLGVPAQLLSKQLLLHLQKQIRQQVSDSEDIASSQRALKILSSMPSGVANTEFALESSLLEIASTPTDTASTKVEPPSSQEHIDTSTKKPNQTKTPEIKKQPPKSTKKQPVSPPVKKKKERTATQPAVTSSNAWVKALSIVKNKHSTLFGLLRNAHAELNDDVCEIEAKFTFHHRRLNDPTNRDAIARALYEATGHNIKVVVKPLKAKPQPVEETDTNDIDVIAQVTRTLGGEVANG